MIFAFVELYENLMELALEDQTSRLGCTQSLSGVPVLMGHLINLNVHFREEQPQADVEEEEDSFESIEKR